MNPLLQELYRANQECCDCNKTLSSSASPVFCNLDVGSFICMECAEVLHGLGFKLKDRDFTPQELNQINLHGGNARVNALYLAKFPATVAAMNAPKPPAIPLDNAQVIYLTRKYVQRLWFEDTMVQLFWDEPQVTIPATSSLSPVASPTNISSSAKEDASSYARAASSLDKQQDQVRPFFSRMTRVTSLRKSMVGGRDRRASSEGLDGIMLYGDGNRPALEGADDDLLRRGKLKKDIYAFYSVYNPEKLDRVDEYTDWAVYYGRAAFNFKLMQKYGADISTLKQQQHLPPSAEKLPAPEHALAHSNNPFDYL